jgi:hypothetical protein
MHATIVDLGGVTLRALLMHDTLAAGSVGRLLEGATMATSNWPRFINTTSLLAGDSSVSFVRHGNEQS